MLQPINTVLPAIAADPYNINVAMPTVDPIGTEQRIEQINQMRAAQAAQRQQLRQGEMSIENQRQQLAQQAERFALEKQKYEASELDAINTLRSTMYGKLDKLTNLPTYSTADEKMLKAWKDEYDLNSAYDVLSSGDRVQIAGVEANMAKATSDPRFQEYVRKVAALDGLMKTVSTDAGRVDLGKARSITEKAAVSGIVKLSLDELMPTTWGRKSDPAAAIKDASDLYKQTVGKHPSTTGEVENYVAFIKDRLNVLGLKVPENFQQIISGSVMSDDELMNVAAGLSSSVDVPIEDVYNYLKLEYETNGRPGVLSIAKEYRSAGIKQRIEESKQAAIAERAAAVEEAKREATGGRQTPADIKKIVQDSGANVIQAANRLNQQYGIPIDENTVFQLQDIKDNLTSAYEKGFTESDVADLMQLQILSEGMGGGGNLPSSLVQKLSALGTTPAGSKISEAFFDISTGLGTVTISTSTRDGDDSTEKTRQMNVREFKTVLGTLVPAFRKAAKLEQEGKMQMQGVQATTTSGTSVTGSYGDRYKGTDFEPVFNAAKETLGDNADDNSASYLMSLMEAESGGNPGAVNRRTGAFGFIQVMPNQVAGFNAWRKSQGKQELTEEDMKNMSQDEYVREVYPYWGRVIKGKPDAAKIGLSVLKPSAARNADVTSATPGLQVYNSVEHPEEYEANIGLDRTLKDNKKKGHINVADVMTHVTKNLPGMTDLWPKIQGKATMKPTVTSTIDVDFGNDFSSAITEYSRTAGKSAPSVNITEVWRDPVTLPKYGARGTQHQHGLAMDISVKGGKEFAEWLKSQQKSGKYVNMDIQFHKSGDHGGTGDHYHITYNKPKKQGVSQNTTTPASNNASTAATGGTLWNVKTKPSN